MVEKRQLAIEARVRDFATATLKRIQASAARFGSKLRGTFRSVFKAVTSTRTALVGFVAVLAVRRIKGFVDSLRENLDVLGKTSDRLGVTTESLSAMNFQAKLAGLSQQELSNAIALFSRNVENAAAGAKMQVDALAKLGLTTSDFAGDQLDLVEVFGKVATGLGGVNEATERTNILLSLFGRSGAKLAPLLKQGEEGIRKLAAEAEKLGLVFSRDEIRRVEDFNDAVTRLTASVEGTFQRLFVEIAPVIQTFVDEFRASFVEAAGDVKTAARGVADSLIDITEDVTNFWIEARGVIDDIVSFFETSLNRIAQAAIALQILFQKVLVGLGTSDELSRLARQGEELRIELRKIGEAAQQAAREQEVALARSTAFFDEIRAKLAEVRAEADKTAEAQKKADAAAAKRGGPTVFESILQGAKQAGEAISDLTLVASQAGGAFVRSFGSALTNTFTDIITGTKKASDAFKELAKNVLRSLAQIISKLAAAAVVKTIFGGGFSSFETGGVQDGAPGKVLEFAKGGVSPRRFAARAFQDGGVASGPTLALFGEGKKREAFVPLPDNRSIPVTLTGGQGATTNIFEIRAIDSRGVREMLIENQGTIKAIYGNSLETTTQQRHTVQRAVS